MAASKPTKNHLGEYGHTSFVAIFFFQQVRTKKSYISTQTLFGAAVWKTVKGKHGITSRNSTSTVKFLPAHSESRESCHVPLRIELYDQ